MLNKQLMKKKTSLLLVLGLTLSAAACGQRGPLVAPTPNANTPTEQQEPLVDQEKPGRTTPTKTPDNGFILDALL